MGCGICDDFYQVQEGIQAAGDLWAHRELWRLHIDADHPGWGLPTDNPPFCNPNRT